MTKILLIMGSARGDGNTREAVDAVISGRKVELINLLEHNISGYDYEHRNQEDDFLRLAKKMAGSDIIVFATPVYWYAMSAPLKTFFDRFTDLITIRKDLGRALAGKKCYLIACGSDAALPEGFEKPFSATCKYLDMEYKGSLYYYSGTRTELKTASKNKAHAFAGTLFATNTT